MEPGQQIMIVGIQNGMLVQTPAKLQLTGPDGRPIQQQPITQHCATFEELIDCLKELMVVD